MTQSRETAFQSQIEDIKKKEDFCHSFLSYLKIGKGIGGVMVSVLVLHAVDRGFEPCWGQTKDQIIGICCFSDKQATLRSKNKD